MTGIQRQNIQYISLNLERRITECIWLCALRHSPKFLPRKSFFYAGNVKRNNEGGSFCGLKKKQYSSKNEVRKNEI
jgi:hypothetical protein